MYPEDEGHDLTPERSGKRVFLFWDQDRLAARFDNWPLFRVLLFSLWFRTVVGLGLLVSIAALVLLPRIWRTSPPGFSPMVTTRLYDQVLGWHFKRQARGLDRAGQLEEARSAWHRAWQSDFANTDSIRGLLRALTRIESGDSAAGVALPAGIWLLRLGHTNTADVVLVAHAWLRTGLGDRAVALLDPIRNRLNSDQEKVYLMSLFAAGQADEFAGRLATNAPLQTAVAAHHQQPPENAPGDDPLASLALYHDAYLAGWGPAGQRAPARDRLLAARDAKETERLAYELTLAVAVHERDLESAADILRSLRRAGLAEVRHYVQYWMLLLTEGRQTEARAMATASNLAPHGIIEILRLAQAFAALELWDEAQALLHRHKTAARWLWELKVLQADVLLHQRNWDGLRELGLEIRTQPDAIDRLGGYGHVVEGIAEWHTENRESAERNFSRAAELGIPQPEAALNAAESLLRLNASAQAEAILLPHRATLTNSPAFLKALLRCADVLRHDHYLLETSQALLKLTPSDPVARNNYASALLLIRVRPQEALAHTTELLQLLPDRVEPRLNHAIALLRVEHIEEARQQLAAVDSKTLPASTLAQFQLAEFELLGAQHQRSEALDKADAIDASQLFPSQQLWLKEAISRVKSAPAP